MEVDVLEMEPGAAPLLFCNGEGPDGTPVVPVAMRISVKIENACFPVEGVYDPDRTGFTFDLNEVADVITKLGSLSAYAYAFFSDAPTEPVRVGRFKIKPVVGCVWQPSS